MSGTEPMNQPGHYLLASARFPMNMNWSLRASDLSDLDTQVFDRSGTADQCGFGLIGEGVVGFEGMGHEFPQFFQRQGFGHKVEGAQFERLNRALNTAVSRDHGNRYFWMVILHMLNERQTIPVRKSHVGQAKVGNLLLQGGLGLRQTTD